MKSIQPKIGNKGHSNTSPFFSHEKNNGFFNPNQSTTAFFRNTPIQTKLTVGEPDDIYEKEADSMADQVVQRMTISDLPTDNKSTPGIQANPINNKITPLVQTKCSSCEAEHSTEEDDKSNEQESEGKLLQRKLSGDSFPIPPGSDDVIQRKCAACEEKEKLQKKSESNTSSSVSHSVENSLNSSKGSGAPLPQDTRTQMESAFGTDFSGVRLHSDTNAIQMNRNLNAQAFTHGSDIYFNSGKLDTNSSSGKHLLAHELTHVVQQGASSSSKPNIQRSPDDIFGNIEEYFKKKQEEEEKAALEAYLTANAPEIIKNQIDIATSAKIYLESENVDKSNLQILRERHVFFQKELTKIETWLKLKTDLSEEDRTKLTDEKNKIIQILSTPLTINKKIDISKFSIAELNEEIQRLQYWLSGKEILPDDGYVIENLKKGILLLHMNEDPPVFWGRDSLTMKKYINVKSPGYNIATIAFYVYGDASKTYLLTNMDGSNAPEFVEIGHFLTFDESTTPEMSVIASSSKIQLKNVEAGFGEGLQSEEVISVVLGGKNYNVTNTQLKVLLVSMFNTDRQLYKIELDFLQDQLKVYSDHKSSSNRIVRGISDTFGGAEFDEDYYKQIIRNGKEYYNAIENLTDGEATIELANSLHGKLSMMKGTGKTITSELMQYMNDTVSGAGTAIKGLEVVKMAGGIAANFVPGLGIVYGGIQDAAQQASGLAHGTQDGWNFESTRNQFALGLAGFGVGKAVGAVGGIVGKGAGSFGAKFLPEFTKDVAKLASSPVGKFVAGTASNVAQNVASAPVLKHVETLLTEGRFANYDEIIGDIKDQFSMQNLILAGASTAMHGKIPDDIHLGGKNTKGYPTINEVRYPPDSKGASSKVTSPAETIEPPKPTITEAEVLPDPQKSKEIVSGKPEEVVPKSVVEEVNPTQPAIDQNINDAPVKSQADIVAEQPVVIGNEKHETVVTKEGVGVCSPFPCPVIHVAYAKELAANPELAKDYQVIQELRKNGKYDEASLLAAELIPKLDKMQTAKPEMPVETVGKTAQEQTQTPMEASQVTDASPETSK